MRSENPQAKKGGGEGGRCDQTGRLNVRDDLATLQGEVEVGRAGRMDGWITRSLPLSLSSNSLIAGYGDLDLTDHR